MNFHGVVVEVMETWPLQLTVISAEITYYVMLDDDTTILHNGAPHPNPSFQHNQHVYITGQLYNQSTLFAQTVDLQDEPLNDTKQTP